MPKQTHNNLIRDILSDLAVELEDEFKRNFERKAFFDKKWKPSPHGLIDSGDLRESITGTAHSDCVEISSDAPYAAIHNEGGRIQVTARMKAWAWHKYKETHKSVYEAIGKMRVGSYIEIPQRQFIGDHPAVDRAVEEIITENVDRYLDSLLDQ